MIGRKRKLQVMEPAVAESLLSRIVVIEREVRDILLASAGQKRIQTACAEMRALIQPEGTKS